MKEQRIKKRYLWLPKTINGFTKWFITASWEESREKVRRFDPLYAMIGGGLHKWVWTKWKSTKWL